MFGGGGWTAIWWAVVAALMLAGCVAIPAGEHADVGESKMVQIVDCRFNGRKGKCADMVPGWTTESRRPQPPTTVTPEEKKKEEESAKYNTRWQKPRNHKVSGLTAKPWHDPKDLGIAEVLERNYPAILEEMQNLMSLQKYGRRFAIDGQKLSEFNLWKLYHFAFNGRTCTENLKTCPVTAKTLGEIDKITNGLFNMNLGLTTFSLLEPTTHIQHHNGPNNLRIRCHLGLITPKGAYLRVGAETREWEAGKTFCFDDSFDHEAWNNATTTRAILMFDVWHYDFTKEQVKALEKYFPATKTEGCREMSGPLVGAADEVSTNWKMYLGLIGAFFGLGVLVYLMRVMSSEGATVYQKKNHAK